MTISKDKPIEIESFFEEEITTKDNSDLSIVSDKCIYCEDELLHAYYSQDLKSEILYCANEECPVVPKYHKAVTNQGLNILSNYIEKPLKEEVI